MTDEHPKPSIAVVEHDPTWQTAFDIVRSDLDDLLCGLSPGTHHVGSTSVPGLRAKPKIDVDVVLRSDETLVDARNRLGAHRDYVSHGDPYGDGMWTFTSVGTTPGRRIYLCLDGTPAHIRRLLFRDRLRDNWDEARRYGELKHSLAIEARGDWEIYNGGKTAFVQATVRDALADRIASVSEGREKIARSILDDLPEWFGIPEVTETYVTATATLPMVACHAPDGSTLGFASLKEQTAFASEIHVMGVLRSWHGWGIGRALVDELAQRARSRGAQFLTVKTLSAAKADRAYEGTRTFYRAVGFLPIEELPTLWGQNNPCVLMLRRL